MVPGHEIAGVVTSAPTSAKFRVGDHVGVRAASSIPATADAQRGPGPAYMPGLIQTYNGPMAERPPRRLLGQRSSREGYVLSIPTTCRWTPPRLLCAGITLYSPLKH
jgi:D-arabinose 1-dehydrogenase-like Zn-dependent alcohol dehydrogenase